MRYYYLSALLHTIYGIFIYAIINAYGSCALCGVSHDMMSWRVENYDKLQ